jgi:AcrR family transcriptional regulator
MPPAAAPAPHRLYPHRRLRTRDRVFHAALAEFRRRGVAAAQIGAIVATARVARGTFYLHFPTKDDVLLELLRRRQSQIAARLRAFRGGTPRAVLRRAVDLLLDDAVGEDRALWHELFPMIARHGAEMRSEAGALVQVLTDLLAAAQKRGTVRTDVAAFDLVAVLLPGVYGLLQMKCDDPLPELRAALHRVVDIFVRGIAR